MPFWSLQVAEPSAVAFIDENGLTVTYRDFDARTTYAESLLNAFGSRTLGFLLCANRAPDVALYVACLRSGHVPLLLPASIPQDLLGRLVQRYQPSWIACSSDTPDEYGFRIEPKVQTDGSAQLHPDLALLLSTSGTTGSPKLVRLSYQAIRENAASIAQYLNITASERAVTALPFSYSYGLSIINSHLHAGASVVLTDASIISKEFWDIMRHHRPTSLAGVPYTYQMLHRTGFTKMELPSLRTLTQAGGRLDPKLLRAFGEFSEQKGINFYVMYGQTEASPRISFVPPERLLEKVGSIGMAIPGGHMEVTADTGELVYRGPNVMMGYAELRPDLARGDELNGILRTGDVGHVDDDGYFFITGRLKRFIKMGGNRIGLDDVETALQDALNIPVSAGGKDDSLLALLESDDASKMDLCKDLLKSKYAIHHTMVRLKLVDRLPVLPTGKKDYSALQDQ